MSAITIVILIDVSRNEMEGVPKAMPEYDLYLNIKKPAIGLYVRHGAGLPDLEDKNDWDFDGTEVESLLPDDLVKEITANGHAFRDME